MTNRWALALALVAGLLFTPAHALAAAPGPAPRADLVDIEDEVMCVTCKVPLNIAEGAQPDSQRTRIRELIAQGWTKAQIKQALVADYGEQVLALPDEEGFGITAYAVPLLLGAILVAALVLLVPRWRRRPASGMSSAAGGSAPGADLSATDARRLDDDLARYEG
ncbi:MAG TPA: cytochrome c-type biogenesis protein CcmH [Solirubrobacteraceae bacterium]|nr:cytochrome c-type biogenesis protein CcmH [Solirubrobacteraceae bacterium]